MSPWPRSSVATEAFGRRPLHAEPRAGLDIILKDLAVLVVGDRHGARRHETASGLVPVARTSRGPR
jgi:hypothetical protein